MRYAITDIHGCPATLRRAIATIDLQPTDELFLLGDYLDRGPDSYGVLQYIWELEATFPHVTCLRGNHEQMFLEEPAAAAPQDLIPPPAIDRATRWMENLLYYHETPGYFLVHAGLNFRHPDPLAAKDDMIWIRYWYADIDRDWLGDRIIVHGHTPEPQGSVHFGIQHMERTQRVCIDSGCSHSAPGMGYLTVLNLDTREGTFVKKVD